MSKWHKGVWTVIRPLAGLFLKLRFGYKYEIAKDLPENYIVLSNHVTDYDPVFVGVSFKRQMYLVGSEHIARWGFLYKLLKLFFAPIMRPKGTVASATVLDIIRHVRKGANVCMFAEGARCWDGVTCPILPSTAKLLQSARCGLVTYKLTGGYFVSPMWSTNLRRGKISGSVVNVYTQEQLSRMSADEIYKIITTDLYEDAYARQLENPESYKGKNLAEGLENLMFICPKCKEHNTLSSKGDTVICRHCGVSFKYTDYGFIEGINHKTVKELSDFQKGIVLKDVQNGTVYKAENTELSTVKKHVETKVSSGTFIITPCYLSCGGYEIPLEDISDLAMHGKHALVFSVGKDYYELLTDKNTNALKFMLYFNSAKNIKTEAVK